MSSRPGASQKIIGITGAQRRFDGPIQNAVVQMVDGVINQFTVVLQVVDIGSGFSSFKVL